MKSVSLLGRVIRLFLALGLAGVIVLCGLTLTFASEREIGEGNATASVRSCQETVPITRFGFGWRTSCVVDIERDDGRRWNGVVRDNAFALEEVGREFRVVAATRPRSPSEDLWVVQKEHTGLPGLLWWSLAIVGLVGGGGLALYVVFRAIIGLAPRQVGERFWAEVNAEDAERKAERERVNERLKRTTDQIVAERKAERKRRREARRTGR